VADAGTVEWIHVTAAGVDTLLFDELRDSDVVVTNAHGVFDRPIAEYVLGAVIAHAKDSRRSLDLQRRHAWQHRGDSPSHRRQGPRRRHRWDRQGDRTAAARAGMDVRSAGRRARADDPDFGEVRCQRRPFGRGRLVRPPHPGRTADRRDRGLVDAAVLGAMKPGAHLVTSPAARSSTSPPFSQRWAKPIGGATLDVFTVLPPGCPPQPTTSPDMCAVIVRSAGPTAGARRQRSR